VVGDVILGAADPGQAGQIVGHRWPRPPIAQHVQTIVGGDAEDPAQGVLVARRRFDVAVNAEKRLLRGVLCRRPIAQDATAAGVDGG
jgi:hypothetical protein